MTTKHTPGAMRAAKAFADHIEWIGVERADLVKVALLFDQKTALPELLEAARRGADSPHHEACRFRRVKSLLCDCHVKVCHDAVAKAKGETP